MDWPVAGSISSGNSLRRVGHLIATLTTADMNNPISTLANGGTDRSLTSEGPGTAAAPPLVAGKIDDR